MYLSGPVGSESSVSRFPAPSTVCRGESIDREAGDDESTRSVDALGVPNLSRSTSAPTLRVSYLENTVRVDAANGDTHPPAVANLRVGLRIANRFVLEEHLGKGGMGEVWRARDLDLASSVAIKFLTPLASEVEALAAFERFSFEARVSAQLGRRTRGIVLVHDIGNCEHGPYLVMEDLGRTTLSARLERGALTVAEVAHVIDRVADALSTAHELGIVDRDAKPSNLFLVDEGDALPRLAIADFGIAKSIPQTKTLARPPKETGAGVVIGSPAYMAPEQLAAEPVDARADVYALGVVAYELLTRELPLRGQSPAGAVALAKFPREIRNWFQQALAEDRAMRFASAPQMACALRAAIAAPRRRTLCKAMAGIVVACALGIAPATGIRAAMRPEVVRAPKPVGSTMISAAAQRRGLLAGDAGPESAASATNAPRESLPPTITQSTVRAAAVPPSRATSRVRAPRARASNAADKSEIF